MKTLLEKIFDGEAVVSFEDYKETREYAAARAVRDHTGDEIETRLGVGSTLAYDFAGACGDIAEMAESEAFQKGFSLAVRLFAEALSGVC